MIKGFFKWPPRYHISKVIILHTVFTSSYFFLIKENKCNGDMTPASNTKIIWAPQTPAIFSSNYDPFQCMNEQELARVS